MSNIWRVIRWISSLKVAIVLLLIIAFASALGTAIPQGEPRASYLEHYQIEPWLGLINGEGILRFQFDHVYSSIWFLVLLSWLSLALMICSWRRQWPTLRAALQWVDYKKPHQLSKLAIAETITSSQSISGIEKLATFLEGEGWTVNRKPGRLSARKGVLGRFGPPFVHIGLVLLMIGATIGAFQGETVEKFLAPGRSFELLNREGMKQLTMTLESFAIDRDPVGRTEQFRSKITLLEPANQTREIKEISVNHPLRFKGMTVYQADWSLASITLQIEDSPQLEFPLTSFPELGDQIWGLVIPTSPDGTRPILLSLSSELGPIQVFDEEGNLLESLRPGGEYKKVRGTNVRVIDVLATSGLLLKRDPGVPIVYFSFAITLLGGILSIMATRQIWALADPIHDSIHLGGLCNRNISGLAKEMPILIATCIED